MVKCRHGRKPCLRGKLEKSWQPGSVCRSTFPRQIILKPIVRIGGTEIKLLRVEGAAYHCFSAPNHVRGVVCATRATWPKRKKNERQVGRQRSALDLAVRFAVTQRWTVCDRTECVLRVRSVTLSSSVRAVVALCWFSRQKSRRVFVRAAISETGSLV